MEQLLSQAYAWRTTFRGYEGRMVSGKKNTTIAVHLPPTSQSNDGQAKSISYSPQTKEKAIIEVEEKQSKRVFSSVLGQLNSSLVHLDVESEKYSSDCDVWLDF